MTQYVIGYSSRHKPPRYKEARRDRENLLTWLWGSGLADKDEIAERRKKAAEPNLAVSLRIGAVAETQKRADDLVKRKRDALAPASTANTFFRKRYWIWRTARQRRIDQGVGSTSCPNRFTSLELTRYLGVPVDGI